MDLLTLPAVVVFGVTTLLAAPSFLGSMASPSHGNLASLWNLALGAFLAVYTLLAFLSAFVINLFCIPFIIAGIVGWEAFDKAQEQPQ